MISLFKQRLSDTLELWQGDEWLLALSDAEDVRKTGGEGAAVAILDVHDFVGTWVMFDVHQLSYTTNVVSS